MDKKRLEIIITSILVLVLIFAWFNSIKLLNKKAKQKFKAPTAIRYSSSKEIPFTELSQKKTLPIAKENIWQDTESIDFLRSPFSGKKYGEEEPVDFKISGIIWDEFIPQVIINDKISKTGDSIEGFIIEKIEKNKVILFNGRRRIELNI